MSTRLEDITNRIVSASATIIAVIAMATAVYQAKLMRDQAKASVWPYLIVGNSGNNGYSRIIQNVGLGPAIIRAFEVRVDGRPVHDWHEAADSMRAHVSWKGARSTTFRAGIVAPTSSMIELLGLPDSADALAFRSGTSHLTTWVCYCSLYGDCWETGAEGFEPKPISRCVDDPKRAFVD